MGRLAECSFFPASVTHRCALPRRSVVKLDTSIPSKPQAWTSKVGAYWVDGNKGENNVVCTIEPMVVLCLFLYSFCFHPSVFANVGYGSTRRADMPVFLALAIGHARSALLLLSIVKLDILISSGPQAGLRSRADGNLLRSLCKMSSFAQGFPIFEG